MTAAARLQARRQTIAHRRGPTVYGAMERSGEIAARLEMLAAVDAADVGDDQAGAVLYGMAQTMER